MLTRPMAGLLFGRQLIPLGPREPHRVIGAARRKLMRVRPAMSADFFMAIKNPSAGRFGPMDYRPVGAPGKLQGYYPRVRPTRLSDRRRLYLSLRSSCPADGVNSPLPKTLPMNLFISPSLPTIDSLFLNLTGTTHLWPKLHSMGSIISCDADRQYRHRSRGPPAGRMPWF